MESLSPPRVLISKTRIRSRVQELGKAISQEYAGEGFVAVCVMIGALVFTADLLRCIDVPVTLDTMELSAYRGEKDYSGEVRLVKPPTSSLRGQRVLIVEDIVDTGHTLAYACDLLQTLGARDVRTCALLSKPERRETGVRIDYVGFHIDNLFVVGYGLDYKGQYRQLPYIGVVNT